MNDCLFCKIISGQIPASIIFENDNIIAFHDIHPKAPSHILIIPKKHIASVNEIDETDQMLTGELIMVAKKIAKDLNIDQTGYRLVINTLQYAGQEVAHLHLHLIGGSKLSSMA